MRKLLMLALLALLTAGSTGCISSNPCGGWHPGALFERRQSAECCCQPVMSAPVMQQGGCCQ